MELFQRIEHLIGKQLPLYPTEEEEVLALMERVSEAQRYAKMVCVCAEGRDWAGGTSSTIQYTHMYIVLYTVSVRVLSNVCVCVCVCVSLVCMCSVPW